MNNKNKRNADFVAYLKKFFPWVVEAFEINETQQVIANSVFSLISKILIPLFFQFSTQEPEEIMNHEVQVNKVQNPCTNFS